MKLKTLLPLILAAAAMPAFAADTKVSAMPDYPNSGSNDWVYVVGGGGTTDNRSSLGQFTYHVSSLPRLRFRRSSFAIPNGNTSAAAWGSGENWSASGTVGAINEAGATRPVEQPISTAASSGSDGGLSNNGFGYYFAGKHIQWACKFSFGDTNNVRCWAGLTRGSMSTMGASDAPAVLLAAFRWSATADATVKFCTGNGGSVTATDTGLKPQLLTSTDFSMFEDVANSQWIAFTNGVPCCTNSANLPSGDKLQSMFSIHTLSATAGTNYLSYISGSCDW
jgi:hypothetical protein